MEQTLFSASELAERWSCSVNYIAILESQGVLTRVGLSKRLYPISQIRQVEMSEEPSPTLKKVEELTLMNERLLKENKHLRRSLTELSRALYEDFDEDEEE